MATPMTLSSMPRTGVVGVVIPYTPAGEDESDMLSRAFSATQGRTRIVDDTTKRVSSGTVGGTTWTGESHFSQRLHCFASGAHASGAVSLQISLSLANMDFAFFSPSGGEGPIRVDATGSPTEHEVTGYNYETGVISLDGTLGRALAGGEIVEPIIELNGAALEGAKVVPIRGWQHIGEGPAGKTVTLRIDGTDYECWAVLPDGTARLITGLVANVADGTEVFIVNRCIEYQKDMTLALTQAYAVAFIEEGLGDVADSWMRAEVRGAGNATGHDNPKTYGDFINNFGFVFRYKMEAGKGFYMVSYLDVSGQGNSYLHRYNYDSDSFTTLKSHNFTQSWGNKFGLGASCPWIIACKIIGATVEVYRIGGGGISPTVEIAYTVTDATPLSHVGPCGLMPYAYKVSAVGYTTMWLDKWAAGEIV